MIVTADMVPIIAAACTGISGLVAGAAVGSWWASEKSSTIGQHSKAIESINSRCEIQRQSLLTDLEKTICSGIKLALKELENQRLQQRATDREEMVEIRTMVNQHDDDIREIFIKLDARVVQCSGQ